MVDTVILVPFTSSDESRIAIWKWTKTWWEQNFSIPIYIGEDHGENFNISSARNRAAEKAGDWQTAIMIDADTVLTKEQVVKGVEMAQKTNGAVLPFTERWELTSEGTKMLMCDETSDWQSHAGRYRYNPVSGCVIVSRDLWDQVQGYDPGFVGWGHEDGAFMAMCAAFVDSPPQRLEGKQWHLEHTSAESKSMNHPVYLANQRRYQRYARAARKDNARELLMAIRNESINITYPL